MANEMVGKGIYMVDDTPETKAIAGIYRAMAEELMPHVPDGEFLTLLIEKVGSRVEVKLTVPVVKGTNITRETIIIQRKFLLDDKQLTNELFEIPKRLQSQGIANIVNAAGAKAADVLGIKTVKLYANIDVGGYAWVRKGFWPVHGKEVLDDFIGRSALSETLKQSWLALTEAEARAFVLTSEFSAYKPALLNSKWQGAADLSDTSTRAAFTGTSYLPESPISMTANQELLDATLRHQIGVRRYSSNVAGRVSALLERADAELVTRLRARLGEFPGTATDFTGQRWQSLLTDVRAARAEAIGTVQSTITPELEQFGQLEGEREVSIMTAAVPIEVTFTTVAADQLKAIVTARPFQGRLLKEWYETLAVADASRVSQALQLGMSQGEPIDDIVRRIVGTRANKYADGILAMTRRDAQAIVRTAVNHVSNTARGYVWEANADIIAAKVWVSTLDGRTTLLCAGRDGKGVRVGGKPLPEGMEALEPQSATPPAHINCRSLMVAVFDQHGVMGDRPAVVDTRTRQRREVDFRQLSKQTGKPMHEVRADWAAKAVGQVPAKTTYQDFMSRQAAAFQNDVLGITRARLFRAGGLRLDQFTDRAGKELTLAQLARTTPEAFTRAQLDPAAFAA